MTHEVRRLGAGEAPAIHSVINAAAERYRGVIPEAADTTPYMAMAELESELDEMAFYGVERDGLAGVIGVQEKDDVTLIRHLYVRPADQRQGLGTQLLKAAIERAASDTVLVGTWAAADWAVAFYEARGFENLGTDEDRLSTYWDIPAHQLEASVVLRYERPG